MSLRTVRILLWLPLVAFLIVLGLVSSGLIKPHDASVHSRMVGNPLPAFSLPSTRAGQAPVTSASFADGKVRLINIFGSWCVPCAVEMPQLVELKREGVIIDGIASRDTPADSLAFLKRYGDPFDRIGDDKTSAVQIAIGSSGVPETYVVDGKGIIRAQHIGPIQPQDMADILAAMKDAQ
ncbi:DsbE family thiol:disulfide interchange protein [Sphingomonas oryzagri]|uniref:DsbE family thiol:disulfide interchange protein n=1 Tax=Sphingomonas oryzagri TaxID=3042314 RepID=A0ABT6MYJ7_9SPHN|nr:DsbE family thiol:disulfide interchange protein [Sphingomonas oryzagri]MDH7637903.1 DsbE family thiol:disulfide interchange protein [Sphingomonas oryzagri]